MEQAELQAIWEQILNNMRDQLAGSAFKWLDPIQPISLTESDLVLGTQTAMAKDWITSHYLTILEDAVTAVVGSQRKIVMKVIEAEKTPEPEPAAEPVRRPPIDTPDQGTLFSHNGDTSTTAEGSDMHIVAAGDSASLNPKYTFDTFVTGSSNRFAHAAAMAVAESPGKVYNPFFMYGGVGLGKTHLMHAIGNRVLHNHPEMRVLYVSSEQFTNEIIRSIQEGNAEKFRQKYRNIDVLLVDDIQFLSGKTSTQEEFFHTFNTLHDAEKQIILSSDRPPREVERLEDRLRSRFEWGLITDIQAPDLETRIAILKNKAQLDHFSVPNDVMVYIASRIDSNIRELEGALTRVVAYASLIKKPVTTDLVAEALKDVFPNNKTKEITMEVIQEIVASYFKIKIDDLHAKKRTRSIAYPRQIAMYLCRELTDTSLPQIGNFFGGRDHTTVLHACDKISKEKESDIKLGGILNELVERIQKM
ncbi:chromosomal replication initiator protein DnaA [Selenomonas ruminis]|uniref:Chromosomal replication initiator protein DnaA n=3 Tax=Selenomonas TaxID=970 RepID=A0A5D6W5F8_9FIRM|nr:chromosomal replication initiator protein DnaA [Selenomonas sp. mPRGC5]TYZ22269.1 chromosomal replication initiator protein DnaA [Selenomonas sp. mPRGC5]